MYDYEMSKSFIECVNGSFFLLLKKFFNTSSLISYLCLRKILNSKFLV